MQLDQVYNYGGMWRREMCKNPQMCKRPHLCKHFAHKCANNHILCKHFAISPTNVQICKKKKNTSTTNVRTSRLQMCKRSVLTWNVQTTSHKCANHCLVTVFIKNQFTSGAAPGCLLRGGKIVKMTRYCCASQKFCAKAGGGGGGAPTIFVSDFKFLFSNIFIMG